MEIHMIAPWRALALACLTMALPLSAQSKRHRSTSDEFNNSEIRLDTTVSLSKDGSVELSSFSGDVKVNSWDRSEVKIHVISRSRVHFDNSPAHVTLIESPLHGEYDDDDEDHTGFEITMPKSARLMVRSVSGDLVINDVGELEAHTVSGEVAVSNVAGRAVLESVSGDVKVDHVGSGLRANSVSGDVRARSIVGELESQTVSGDLELTDVKSASVRGETVSGEVHFSGPVDPRGHYEFHSHSGDVTLNLAGGGADATLELETYSGDLDSPCAMTMQPGGTGARSGKRGTFTLGNGGGAHFIIRTFSGDVRITGCRSHGDK
jgi:DUF4097 and DUF4098 domain-containing protein YvlB